MPPALFLLVLAVAFLLVAYWQFRRAGHSKQATGMPDTRISVVYSDTGEWEKFAETLYSEEYRLSGKPDYILRLRRGLIPVELKPLRSAPQPYQSDILQLAAYCLLIEECFDFTPPYGLLRYKDQTFRVEWTPALRLALLDTLDEMRDFLLDNANLDWQPGDHPDDLPEPQHNMTVRCRACGYRNLCHPAD